MTVSLRDCVAFLAGLISEEWGVIDATQVKKIVSIRLQKKPAFLSYAK